MEDDPPTPRRRSPSPQRGVLTPSINLEDEYEQMQDGENTMMTSLEKKPAALLIKKTAYRETRSLPCSPQHRLVDDRHQWIAEKLLSFDEQDKAELAQPALLGTGKGELIENRHKWIHQEILDKKTMQHASPRFDEGKYGPIRVANGSPPSSPKNNNADDYCGIVEVISSADDDALDPATERECIIATERKSAGAVSLSDTISMEDFNVPGTDSQTDNLDTVILSWEAVVEQQLSMDAIAMETTAATKVLLTKAELPNEGKKLDEGLVAVGPEPGKNESASFLGDIETPHKTSARLESKSVEESTGKEGPAVAPTKTNDKVVEENVKVLETGRGEEAELEVATGENFHQVVELSIDKTPNELDLVASVQVDGQASPTASFGSGKEEAQNLAVTTNSPEPAATEPGDEDPTRGRASPTSSPFASGNKEAENLPVTTSSPEPAVTDSPTLDVIADIAPFQSEGPEETHDRDEEAFVVAATSVKAADSAIQDQKLGEMDSFAISAMTPAPEANNLGERFDCNPDFASPPDTCNHRSSGVVVQNESVEQLSEEYAVPGSTDPVFDESTDAEVLVEHCVASKTEETELAGNPNPENAVVMDAQQTPTHTCDIEKVTQATALFGAPKDETFDGRTAVAVEAPEESKKEVTFGVSTDECLKQTGSTLVGDPSLTEQYVSTILLTEGVEERMATMESWASLSTRSTTDMYIESMKADGTKTTPKDNAASIREDHPAPVVTSVEGADAITAAGGIPAQDKTYTDFSGDETASGVVVMVEKGPEKMGDVGAALAETSSLEVQTAGQKCLVALALEDEPLQEKKPQMNRRVSFEFGDIGIFDETTDKSLAHAGKGSSPAWEAVTEYLTCNSPCHNQADTSFSFEAKLKSDSVDSTTDEAIDNPADRPSVSDNMLATETQSKYSPVALDEAQAMPSMVDNDAALAADSNAIDAEVVPFHTNTTTTKEEECPVGTEEILKPVNTPVSVAESMAGVAEHAAEEEGTTEELDTSDEPVLASPKSTPVAGVSALFDADDSAENPHEYQSPQMLTYAEQSSEIDYGYLSQSVVEHARRNKERLEKAKQLLLNDVPVPTVAKPSIDPAIEYKKKRLEKAKNLLLELADVKSSVVHRQASPHELINSSSDDEKEKAKDQNEPIITSTQESNNAEKNIIRNSTSTDLAEPVIAQCSDQCTIS